VPREQSRWQGTTTVSDKRVNPSWRPTPDMIKENPKLPSWVPGGHPMNPLGVRAMYLGASTYRIHGTDAPWTIGQAVSKGCIRMYNEDVLDLYPRVAVGARVTVTWERFGNQAVASSSYDEMPQPLQPAAYKTNAPRRTIRNLPPPPDSVREAVTAAVRMDSPTPAKEPVKEKSAKTEKAEKPAKTAARSSDAKPADKSETETDKASSSAGTQGATSAAEAAKKAAEAAAKAAEAARRAAEAAKKAAEDAKKATEAVKEPDKSAAL
jgi:hypothetical protein